MKYRATEVDSYHDKVSMKSVDAEVNFVWEVRGGCHGFSDAGWNGDFRDIFPQYVIFPAIYQIFNHHTG